ncbi:hypothetical protein DND132_2526 [Pseudodesulfovibrio mercurii]|uniref:Uncharacterized protein n=1 Tax=Pseudodesulfovibrio mercurii TaxID=641491 RepID=F0JCP9_9BACT|nr:hypothetical protein [Pseudodesulfovibrio mercurii]EGB15729.1 hypothetical protein DND132_2526 [Pseudodesulfovibrio mercurii]
MKDDGLNGHLRQWAPVLALSLLLLLPARTASGYGGGGDVKGLTGGGASESSTPPTGYTPASFEGALTEGTLSGVTISSDWAEVDAEQAAAEQEALEEQAAHEQFMDLYDEEGMEIMRQEEAAASQTMTEQEIAAEREAQDIRQQHILEQLADRSPQNIAAFVHEFPTMELQEQYIDIRTQIHHLDDFQSLIPEEEYQEMRDELVGQIQTIRQEVAQQRGEEVMGQFTQDVAVNVGTMGLATYGTPGVIAGHIASVGYNYVTGGTRGVATGVGGTVVGSMIPGELGPVAGALIQGGVDAAYEEVKDAMQEDDSERKE